MAEDDESIAEEIESGGEEGGEGGGESRRNPRENTEPQEVVIRYTDPEGPDPDAWMVTFSDLLTLLMTFFVLIFASQDPVAKKINEAFGQSTGVFGQFRTTFFEKIAATVRMDISEDRLQVFLDEVGAIDIDVKQEDKGLLITLPSHSLFAPGKTKLSKKAKIRIKQLSEYLVLSKHPIRVVGHADNREARETGFIGPWQLSVRRAHEVLKEMLKYNLPEERLSLVGYGPSKPRFNNLSRLGRGRNRRVEIIILNRGETNP